ncbi:glycosyl transferase, group 1 [Indibacter alkaliphilus LW1]|uniref:Glycosyl transferase, group 1 n=1 Tax=Indibacter alkaliphilus (strain CCUG 57479 / KCTC 22604 / LW1) TaxID=1189612 RepID=S2E0S7_INDAL|nr:glycosyltransferase family 4 protein [Indibacter alkaliphilus]EOZ95678.1 glycosyl transferase, group 1 [Indibacter alkaliphilus LW1]
MNSPKTKILLWAPLGSGLHYWGPGISAYNLFQGLDKNTHEIHLAHGFPQQRQYPLFDSQNFIHHLIFKNKWSMSKYLFFSKKWLKKHAAEYDVLYSLSPHHIGIMPAFWFKKYGGKKSFIKMTALNDGFNDNSLASTLLGLPRQRKKAAVEIDGFVALSSEIVEELREADIPTEKIKRIPNGVNTERFAPVNKESRIFLEKELGLESGKFRLIFTGGLSHRKGPSVIVQSMIGLVQKFSSLEFLLIGPERDNGEEMSKIKSHIKENLLLQNHIKIVDHVHDIEKYYNVSDLFILPSLNEGMSNSLLEAMSSGLPVLATPVSGTRDVVLDGEMGFVLERDSKIFAEKIEFYLLNPDEAKKHGHNARKRIQEEFNSKKILEDHLNLFEI